MIPGGVRLLLVILLFAARASYAECSITIDVHVVDKMTHQPMPGAFIVVNNNEFGETDDSGHLLLKQVCEDSIIHVTADGYQAQHHKVENLSRTLEIELDHIEGDIFEIVGEAITPERMTSEFILGEEALRLHRGKPLADILETAPGVTKLSAGTGFGKPMVRGAYGRRLPMFVDGVPHRNQNWGLDHAPEIDPSQSNNIAVVRSNAGVEFGAGAMGAISLSSLLIPVEPATKMAFYSSLSSNGGGNLAVQIAKRESKVPIGWALWASGGVLGDNHTPDYRLTNTASNNLGVGGILAYRFQKSEIRLSYSHYRAKLGVCNCLRLDSPITAETTPANPQGRSLSFEIKRPHQNASHDKLSTKYESKMGAATLRSIYAFQFNHRREFDTVRKITIPQFDFQLDTHDWITQVQHDPIHISNHLHVTGLFGLDFMVQRQRYNGLTLVPDYNALSTSLYLSERLVGHHGALEAGVRVTTTSRDAMIEDRDFDRMVRDEQFETDDCSKPLPMQNGSPAEQTTCSRKFQLLSSHLGGRWQVNESVTLKGNLAYTQRAPDVDELYLNGTSPSFPVLALGEPFLKSEKSASFTLGATFRNRHITLEASAFANRVDDYVGLYPVLKPNGDPVFDVLIRGTFPRFATRSTDATLIGGEFNGQWRLPNQLDLTLSGSVVRGTSTIGFLPFVPPPRGRVTIDKTFHFDSVIDTLRLNVGINGVLSQTRTNNQIDLLPPPQGYVTLDSSVSATRQLSKRTLLMSISGSNLTNTKYRDYTSLLRYFADNQGWQLFLRVGLI